MFSTKRKLIFIASYIYYIFRVPIETKKGKLPLFLAQINWVLERLVGAKLPMPTNLFANYVETIFGKFYINQDLISNFAVSPSFERTEINNLFTMIDRERKLGRRILFIDIGAFFGLYTVAVGNRYKKYTKLDIVTFEPGTEYLSQSTLGLLAKNISKNGLKNVTLHKIGIGSRNGLNEDGMKIKTLDSIFGQSIYKKYDVVFIKLDIDDFVIDGLKGIQSSVEKFGRTVLLIEDFVKFRHVVSYLRKNHYKFLSKYTPYNSFWTYIK